MGDYSITTTESVTTITVASETPYEITPDGTGASTAVQVTADTTPLTENLADVDGDMQSMLEAIDGFIIKRPPISFTSANATTPYAITWDNDDYIMTLVHNYNVTYPIRWTFLDPDGEQYAPSKIIQTNANTVTFRFGYPIAAGAHQVQAT